MIIMNLEERNNSSLSNTTTNFDAVWEHCLANGFLYPTKLKQLGSSFSELYTKWQDLIGAGPELFQFCPGYDGEKISCSISTFRDTPQMYVAQYAGGAQQPMKMLRCMITAMDRFQTLPSAEYLSVFFRPEATWPALVASEINRRYSPRQMSLLTRHYLICWPHETAVDQSVRDRFDVLTDESSTDLSRFMRVAVDPIRAASLGIGSRATDTPTYEQNYSDLGLTRTRSILGVRRDNELAAVAVCYHTNTLMNFSFMCNRAEIFIHPDAPDRTHVIYDIASAVIYDAAQRGKLVCPLLIDALDMPLTIGTGFQFTAKRFTNVIWQREPKRGWSVVSKALEDLYQTKLSEFAQFLLPS